MIVAERAGDVFGTCRPRPRFPHTRACAIERPDSADRRQAAAAWAATGEEPSAKKKSTCTAGAVSLSVSVRPGRAWPRPRRIVARATIDAARARDGLEKRAPRGRTARLDRSGAASGPGAGRGGGDRARPRSAPRMRRSVFQPRAQTRHRRGASLMKNRQSDAATLESACFEPHQERSSLSPFAHTAVGFFRFSWTGV